MKSLWRARTVEAAGPDTNLNARPRRVAAHFRDFLRASPLTVVDVGARGGIPGELEPLRPYVDLIAVEPDPEEAARLEARLEAAGLHSHAVLPAAVGPSGETFTLHVTRDPGRSSLLEPNMEVIRRYGQEGDYAVTRRHPVRARGLGELLAERGIERIDLLKLDVQGFELEALKTLGDARWRSLLMIETEVEFVELYRGQPLFRDVDAHLSPRGFELFHLIRVFAAYRGTRWMPYGRGQLQFGEAYYLRTRHEPLSALELAKLMFLAAYYGFNDYGAFLFRHLAARLGELTPETCRLFREYFAPFDARRPRFPGVAGTGLRLVLDRVLFRYLAWRRWNGLRTDTDRAYPIR